MFKKLRRKIRNMSISSKLRLISSVTLFIPLTLSIMCCAVIYLTFVTNQYPSIVRMMDPVINADYAYQACEYIYEVFSTQLEENGDEDITKLFLDDQQNEQGVVYLQITKNGELLYHTTSYEKPENFEELYSYVDNEGDKVFSIVNDDIIFRITLKHEDNSYILFAHGNVRTFYPYERTAGFYIDFLLVNFMFIVIVAITVLILSKILNKSVFDRVEYSLAILSDGVKKITEGNLDYRIEYRRKDEFKPICDSFNEMAVKLKESIELIQKQDKNQKEVLLGITHDIFSPLTSIKAYVEGLQSGIATTKTMQNKYLEIINTKAEEIEKTVSEMLFYSKIEYDNITTKKAVIDLSKFIESYVKQNKEDYSVKNIQLIISKCEKSLIFGDEELITRLITNVIDNSGKYSNKPVCHVEISLENYDSSCILKISDDGPGVPENDVNHLFEIFYTGDKSRQNHAVSNGIGLSIVNNITTKILGGTVYAENIKSGGLSITITLPTVKE